MSVCAYGCGKPAIKYFKFAKKWCCENNVKACPAVKERQAKTCMEKYGCTNPSASPAIIKKKKESAKLVNWTDVSSRRKTTCIERYGADNPSKVESIQQKRNITYMERFGAHPLTTSEVIKKRKLTSVARYGFENPGASNAAVEKRKEWWKKLTKEEKETLVQKSLVKKIDKGIILNFTEENLQELKIYRRRVKYYTEQCYKKNRDVLNPNNLLRGKTEYHLDHIYSIIDGFINNVSPEMMSIPRNLRIMHYKDNIAKGGKSEISLTQLQEAYDECISNKT
jgi:hypothetical protein